MVSRSVVHLEYVILSEQRIADAILYHCLIKVRDSEFDDSKETGSSISYFQFEFFVLVVIASFRTPREEVSSFNYSAIRSLNELRSRFVNMFV